MTTAFAAQQMMRADVRLEAEATVNATEAAVSEEQLRVERWRAAQFDLRIVDVVLQRGQGSVTQSPLFNQHARPTSRHIVWACVQYAASVRYHRVTLSDLSASAGVSERRVRDAFSECLHMSPTAYLRVAALVEVRRTLLEAPPARDAVTRAASDFGFWHLSRFASQYRAVFGESPSETVARARAAVSTTRFSKC